ncbi:Diaphanous GTPase-binding [Penicillium hetheringtonii]|uniref:Diaphanous GTPase-binding n=1 Tax=Penicillium hetheringtonii TaxID=911720 RepID=A0AAD6GYN9_9EURO|nr:Diaphanous GTPase-binding [Penicillium hetheringtonii]
MASSTFGPQIFDDANRPPARSSVFRDMMSKPHKRNQSADDAMAPPSPTKQPTSSPFPWANGPSPGPGHLPLSEIVPNRDAGDSGTTVQKTGSKENKGALHKKTKSAVSLKSLRSYMGKDKPDETNSVASDEMHPKKTKSTNSLSAILKRSQRGRKGDGSKQSREKENRSPTDLIDNMPSQFHPQCGRNRLRFTMTRVADEVSLYTPKGYSPAQQRNFYDFHQPSLARTGEGKARPKSDCLEGNRKLKGLVGTTMQREQSRDGHTMECIDTTSTKGHRLERSRKMSAPESPVNRPSQDQSSPKKLSRVQAAISAFNAKERDVEVHKHLDSKDLESEFEKLLDARNIPHNMRDKMRSLDTNIKADFIQKDKTENGPPHSAGTGDSRRGRGNETKDSQDPAGSTASLTDAAAVDTAADPSDFVHYLREIQKPEMIEVGKIHKLRLLLRNETVAWVNGFITEGGMDEIVQLVYRIMKMEWREDHEDTLLHEALLCLKALCTTSIALAHLTRIERELFPALLKMLFNEEKKGPSEFTTRGIIINLLFTQLSAISPGEVPGIRAKRILSYLRDPSPEDENQPVAFIANIYQSRPYRVWCKEVTNVTKEVFWIFLHHLNVIPLPKGGSRLEDPFTETSTTGDKTPYYQRHFPPPRPPVPAAPYVGGVEWDATNYLAAHLDLLNGLIASLPTIDERNQLRGELRASGFEKVMGGSLRTCKEKFYSSVHDCLRTWVAAAADDGWPYIAVREGPPRSGEPGSPTKSPKKAPGSPKKGFLEEQPPKLELALDLPENRPPAGPGTPSSDLRSWL